MFDNGLMATGKQFLQWLGPDEDEIYYILPSFLTSYGLYEVILAVGRLNTTNEVDNS